MPPFASFMAGGRRGGRGLNFYMKSKSEDTPRSLKEENRTASQIIHRTNTEVMFAYKTGLNLDPEYTVCPSMLGPPLSFKLTCLAPVEIKAHGLIQQLEPDIEGPEGRREGHKRTGERGAPGKRTVLENYHDGTGARAGLWGGRSTPRAPKQNYPFSPPSTPAEQPQPYRGFIQPHSVENTGSSLTFSSAIQMNRCLDVVD